MRPNTAMMKGFERREHLKMYLLSCVRDSELNWLDFTSPAFLDKLLKILSRDVKVVGAELGRQGGAGLINMGAAVLSQLVAKKR